MKKINKRVVYQQGQAMITAVVFFLVISIIIMVAIATPVANQIRASADFLQSKQGYIAAEAANDDALYRLNKGRTLPATIVLPFTTSTSSASVTDVGNVKQITSLGYAGSFTRSVKTQFSQGTGLAFNYGLQVGNGGYQMSGGAGIYGNVYSNGDIIGTGGPFITGTAVAASAANPVANQSNTGSSTPSNSITFGATTANQDIAQSFIVSTTSPVTELSFYVLKNGTPSNATIRIAANNSGKPSSSSLMTATLSAANVTSNYGWVTLALSPNTALTVGTTYWIVFDNVPNWSSSNNYVLGATNNTYAGGSVLVGNSSSNTWAVPSPSTLDTYFNLYTGGNGGTISGITVGSGGVGDAIAQTVNNSTVAGTIYCQIGTGNNQNCNTTHSAPSQQSMPISQAQITQWESDATSGGTITGGMNLGGSTATSTGPKKIVGDLTVGGGATLTVTGTLYVTGNININGGAVVQLGSSYGTDSGVIVTDGTISLSGGGQVKGDGQSGSYILLLTNSTCPSGTGCGGLNAIEAGGGTGAVVLAAQNGTINFTGGTGAKSAVANEMIMGGGTTITYDSGLSDLSFTSGPSGAWNVDSWQEVAQ